MDIIGKSFGKLIVLSEAGVKEYGKGRIKNRMIMCQCECGNIKTIRATNVVNGMTVSCGCWKKTWGSRKFRDITGRKFNKLTAISPCEEKEISGGYIWNCLCDCGKNVKIPGRLLRAKSAISCGCAKIANLIFQNPAETYLCNCYKRSAIKRGFNFGISNENFSKLINGNCYYCNQKPSNIAKKGKHILIYSGIDRIDPKKDYLYDNCVSCCKKCNIAKSNMNCEDFKNWINQIYKNYILGNNA